jgi:signal transduction histidine kinase
MAAPGMTPPSGEAASLSAGAVAQFFWLASAKLNRGLVDLAPIAHNCIAGLRQADPNRAVECSIAHYMWADADNRLLKLALDILLGNAWKYASHVAVPSIEVGIELSSDKEMHYFVRDNGMGFAAAAVPGKSNRLEGEDFAAVGIGLATAKRIIEKHGGSIWATWNRSKVTTIYFTLPPRDAAPAPG